jgi:hypothetical protein
LLKVSTGVRAVAGALALTGSITLPVWAQSGSATVLGTANIYLADVNGPGNSGGGGAGTEPNAIPLTSGTGRTLTFGSVTGTWGCGPGANGPDGGPCTSPPGTNILAEGAIAGIRVEGRNMFLVGLFLGAGLPGAAPLRATYTAADLSTPNFAPVVGQVFFIGDALTGTGSGTPQTFDVPDDATRLFLGIADAFAFGEDVAGGRTPGYYDDNSGSVVAEYAIGGVSAVPEPSSLALASTGALALAGWGLRRRRLP